MSAFAMHSEEIDNSQIFLLVEKALELFDKSHTPDNEHNDLLVVVLRMCVPGEDGHFPWRHRSLQSGAQPFKRRQPQDSLRTALLSEPLNLNFEASQNFCK